jgi:hypothetical protein
VPSLIATVDLQAIFSGAFGTCTLLALPKGSQIHPWIESEYDRLFFLLHGHATWTILTSVQTNQAGKAASDRLMPEHPDDLIRLYSDGQDTQQVQSVLVPRGVACGVTNRASGDYPLLMVCLTVRREDLRTAASPTSVQANLLEKEVRL